MGYFDVAISIVGTFGGGLVVAQDGLTATLASAVPDRRACMNMMVTLRAAGYPSAAWSTVPGGGYTVSIL